MSFASQSDDLGIESMGDDFDIELPQGQVCHVGPKTYAGTHVAHNVDRQGDRGEVIFSVFGHKMVSYP